ncbi:MAG: UvrD-helicase domain-containing protein [Nitrococcus mobilis]|nr:UvrD-helicase domain-containing protein [Nitrococcus mobilis]
MEGLQVAISQDFFTAFARIPRSKQKKVNEFVSKFRNNPHASGINYEKINDAASSQYRSVRIDQDYRGIVLKPEKGNVYLLLWVDKHNAAYDWARRHRCEVNPLTGSLQLYETIHDEGQTDAAPVTPGSTSEDAEPLLGIRSRELLRLGVPEDRLAQVQGLTAMTQLEGMESQLPVEAFEALCFLADGVPLDEVMEEYALPDGPEVDPEDVSAALQRAQSRRRFHVVGDELELQQMLEAPLEQWRVFLHPTQRRLVERDWNGPVRVLGGAGTGKTVVAMHRARWLVKTILKPSERLLLTTFTRNLATDIEANLRKICSADQMKQIEVTNIDAWVHRFLKRESHSARIVYPGQEAFEKCWKRGMQLADGALELPDSFYEEEWRRVILPQRVMSQPEYFKASRAGRGVPLSRKQRARIWPVFEEVRFQLHQAGAMISEDAVFTVLDMLAEGAVARPYRAAIVDEAQDFGMEALKLIRALVPDGKNNLMIVGDGHQRIYGRKASLSQCGIDIRGRGRKLRINYRTTEQIRRLATAVLEGVDVDDLDNGNDPVKGYRSLIQGQPPVIKGFDTELEESSWVVGEIESLLAEGMRSQDICVVGRTITQLKAVSSALQQRGLETHGISRDSADNTHIGGVRLANMHRIKGLEFKAVFLVGVRDGVVPLALSMTHTEDPIEKRARDLNERALLHVAGTRAVHSLYITWSGEPSPLLKVGNAAEIATAG